MEYYDVFKFSIFAFILIFSYNSFSAIFSNSSITLLRGDNFQVGDDKSRTEVCYENINKFE